MIRTFIPCNHHFQEEIKNNMTANSITKRYQDRLSNALAGNENVQQMVDHILESLMNLINRYKPFDGYEISCIEISFDKRYCYAWSKGGEIAVIKDASVNDPAEIEQKKLKLK